MAKRQKPKIELANTGAAVNVADGLAAGQYQFQARGQNEHGVYYAFGTTAPEDMDAYHLAEYGELVRFRVPTDSGVWVRTYPFTTASDRYSAVLSLSSI